MTQIKQKILALISMICMTTMLNAQQIDQKKMNKDLEISENIFASLIKSHEGLMFHNSNPKATYVSEYGVIIKLSGGVNLIDFNSNRFSFSFDSDHLEKEIELLAIESERLEENSEGLSRNRAELNRNREELNSLIESSKNSFSFTSSHSDHDYDDDNDNDGTIIYFSEKDKDKIKIKSKSKEDIEAKTLKSEEMLISMMKDFLIDYADLIGQLKPEQKIMIVSGGNHANYFGNHHSKGSKITAEITKGDLSKFKEGKLSRKILVDKIKITKSDGSSKKTTDLELISSIFTRLYKPDLSDTYYMSGGMYYEHLEGFGVIYNMKMYSSTSNNGRHKIVTLDISGLSQEERNKKVNELYPQFEKELKENILDYGKTVKSLGEKETLMFKVKLTECHKCTMPKSIDVSISNSVITAYNSGKINRTDALKKIQVKKLN